LLPSVEERSAPPRRRLGRRLALFLVLLISLAVGGLYTATSVVVHVDNVVLPGVNVAVPKPVAKVLPGLAPPPPEGSPGTKRVNILLLGVDRRPHHDPAQDGPPNTDSIHILSLDPISKTATALSLPRDLYLEIPSPEKKGEFWEARVNTAYRLGEEAEHPGGGAAFAKRVIEYNFHLPIDYYAIVDWVAFADVIDALGGVWVTVPETLTNVEGFNPRDGNSFTITIPAGTHYMDAITALAYARFRGDDQNDFGRIERQQAVMRAAADEALRAGWLTQAPKLYDRFRSAIQTDLGASRIPGLVLLAKSIGIENVRTVSLAGPNHEAVKPVLTPWGEDVLVPRWELVGAILREAIDDPALRAEGATVTVVNATGVRGQGERAVSYLQRFLLPPERISLASSTETSSAAVGGARAQSQPLAPASFTTTISYTGEAGETAARVAEWLGLPDGRITRTDGIVDAPAAVTVTLGTDLRLPDDERFLRYRAR
jgi:polyisoprenyl-teichoic acid--peptidoglycan teichoic acid transferase